MGYRRALLGRWSVRDRLGVLVVAVTVAFLVGSVLVVLAAGGQATAIATEFTSPGTATYYPTPDLARERAPEESVVLPVSAVRLPDGGTTTVVAVPRTRQPPFAAGDVRLPTGRKTPTRGDLEGPERMTLAGPDGRVSVVVHPPDGRARALPSLFPPSWVLADGGTVRRLGPTGAFVLTTDNPKAGGYRSTPLRGALGFFLAGTRQALGLLRVFLAGGAVLVGVTVFSVTRMSVRDRMATIRLVRSTGGRPAGVLGVFAARALALTALGVALGYALGLVLCRAVVNAAVAVGLPTSLSIRVTPAAMGVLVPTFVTVLAVGAVAGLAAAWPAARRPPARLTAAAARTTPAESRTSGSSRLRRAATPALLGWRPLVPSVATLAAFVAVVALVAALGSVAAPVAGSEDATITEPGSAHPVGSQVPTTYTTALRDRGIDASAEILLFEVIDGRPVPARGADYEAFASVTPARLVRGRPPAADHEAVVGADLAETLDVGPGDRLPLGGSTRTALDRVTVVGVFLAPGPFDDQVVVPLDTARHLSTVEAGRANVIRAEKLPDRPASNGSVGILEVHVPGRVVANRSMPVRVTVGNAALEERTTRIAVRFRGQSREVRVSVPRTSRRTVTVRFDAGSPGTGQVRAGDRTRRVRVVRPDALALVGVPARAPPGSEPRVRVVNATGHPMSGDGANATVTVTRTGTGNGTGTGTGNGTGNGTGPSDDTGPGTATNHTVEPNAAGYVRLPLAGAGAYRVRATSGDRSVRATITVRPGVTRQPTVDLEVSPARPSPLSRPTVRVDVYNPWNRTLARTLTVGAPGGPRSRTPTLEPGERTTVTVRPAGRPPGEYDLRVSAAGETLAATSYRVTGDERILSALATGGRTGTTGIGRALAVAFGNLQLVLGALVGLAGLMTVGATTATFAQAVHARARTVGIRRATGAPPGAVLRLVLADAARVGIGATALAIGLALGGLRALAAGGSLAVFGVRLSPIPSPVVLAGTAVGALGLTLLGAGLATAGLLARPPADLVDGGHTGAGRPEASEPPGETIPAGESGSVRVDPPGGNSDD